MEHFPKCQCNWWKVAFSFLAIFLCSNSAFSQLSGTEKADIGFTALQTKLGGAMPTGSGISVSQVEAPESGNYRPNTALFSDKTFTFPSGGSTSVSSHATTVGQYFYGSNSLASSIGATANSDEVTSYEANNWIQSGFLRTGSPVLMPKVETNDIQNHSWIGSTGDSTTDTEILRRIDFAIARDDFVAVFGLNNGSGTSLPNLLAQSYNGITVGLSNGNHSRGTTTIDGTGRTKPDIVVPTSATSWAVPTVGGAAALLIETARTTGGLSNAQTSETVKALLLAGATKDESEFGREWTHTSTQPLDAVFGAGELNIENSYDILVSGEKNASSSSDAASTGWDFGTSSILNENYYFFDLTPQQENASFTAVLSWNRTITSGSLTSFVPNLDLRLYQASGYVLGSLLESSISTIDNVELVYSTGLASGRYVLAVSADTSGTEYGLAWTSVVPEPGMNAFLIFTTIVMVGFFWKSRPTAFIACHVSKAWHSRQ